MYSVWGEEKCEEKGEIRHSCRDWGEESRKCLGRIVGRRRMGGNKADLNLDPLTRKIIRPKLSWKGGINLKGSIPH